MDAAKCPFLHGLARRRFTCFCGTNGSVGILDFAANVHEEHTFPLKKAADK